jgi:hypothetical protein
MLAGMATHSEERCEVLDRSSSRCFTFGIVVQSIAWMEQVDTFSIAAFDALIEGFEEP